MRFIRKNGRVIPIREGQQSAAPAAPKKDDGSSMTSLKPSAKSHYKAFAVMGAAAQLVGTKNRALTSAAGLIIGGSNIVDSFKYGSEKHSFWGGVGRNLKNTLALVGGRVAGGIVANHTVSILRDPGTRAAVRKAGSLVRRK